MQTTTAIAAAIAPAVLAFLGWVYKPAGVRFRAFLRRRLPNGRLKDALLRPVD